MTSGHADTERTESARAILDTDFLAELAQLARGGGARQNAARKMLANFGAQEQVVASIVAALRCGAIRSDHFSLWDAVELLQIPLTVAVEVLIERVEADPSEIDARFLDLVSWQATHRRPWTDGQPSDARSCIKLLRSNARVQAAIAQHLETRLRTEPLGPAWYCILRMAEIIAYPSSSLVSAIAQLVLGNGHRELVELALGAMRSMIKRGAGLGIDDVHALAAVLIRPLRGRALDLLADAGYLDRAQQDVLRDRLHAIIAEGPEANGRVLARDAAVVAARIGLDDEITVAKIRALGDDLLPQTKYFIALAYAEHKSRAPAVLELMRDFALDRDEEVARAARSALRCAGVRAARWSSIFRHFKRVY